MSQTNTQTSASVINWQSGKCGKYSSTRETEIHIKKAIARALNNDRMAVMLARQSVAKHPNFDLLEKSEQDRQLTEVSLHRIQQRITKGVYVSCKYPEYEGYVPQLAYGMHGHVLDDIRKRCWTRQLAALRQEYAEAQPSSDDEDEIPPWQGDIKQETNSVSHTVEPHKEGQVRKPDDKERRNGGDMTTTKKQEVHHKDTSAAKLKRKRSETSKGDGNDHNVHAITWRVVSRGFHLLPGSPAPEFKQSNSKSNPWFGRVVFRGQAMADHIKNED